MQKQVAYYERHEYDETEVATLSVCLCVCVQYDDDMKLQRQLAVSCERV